MAVCMFLGHNDYFESNINEKIIDAVETVVQQENEIDFHFINTDISEKFPHLAILAVHKAKFRYPQKKITITCVTHYEDREWFVKTLKTNCAYLPSSFIDRVISYPFMPVPKTNPNDCTFATRQIRQQEVLQADYIISYVYSTLDTPLNRRLSAGKRNGAVILDVANEDTNLYIIEATNLLPPRQKYIHQAFINGQPIKQIGESLGVSPNAIRPHLHKSSRTIQKYLRDRMFQQLQANRPTGPHICCLPLMDTVSDCAMKPLNKAIDYLIKNNLVTNFVIMQEYPALEQIFALQDFIQRFTGNNLPVQICTTKAGNTQQQMLLEIKELIEQSDFCICDLSATPYAKEIIQFAGSARRAIIIDIGDSYGESV